MSASLLFEPSVVLKIKNIESELHQLLVSKGRSAVPQLPAREIEVRKPSQLPDKKGLGTREGQARLLHDLANIELQAMELCVRTLIEFPEAPREFRNELAEIALDESRHLKLCLDGLEELNSYWGRWPIHLGLWSATHEEDDLIDRLLIVHRYLEGSGLDAGDRLLRHLVSTENSLIRKTVRLIHEEEFGHVQFGSTWFKRLASGQDPDEVFCSRMKRLEVRLPRRLEKMQLELRQSVGFTSTEVQYLQSLQDRQRRGHEPN